MSKPITGLGGYFFKTPQPDTIRKWYDLHLGIATPDGSACLPWTAADDQNLHCFTVWSTFPDDTLYFEPGKRSFMINFRVTDLEALRDKLRKAGVEVMDKTEALPFGKFGWIVDPYGQKIELWQPSEEHVHFKSSLRNEGMAGISEIRIFVDDPAAWLNWYSENLGLEVQDQSLYFSWMDERNEKRSLHIRPLPPPPQRAGVKQDVLLAYLVFDLPAKLEALRAAGIEVPVANAQQALLCDPDGRYLQLVGG